MLFLQREIYYKSLITFFHRIFVFTLDLASHNTSQQKTFAHAAILAQLAHRGPDAQAHWGEQGIDLYHSRLSIIDTDERANQPFHAQSGRYVLVFNGDIYNFQQLKAGLSYPWQTQSDTEVSST